MSYITKKANPYPLASPHHLWSKNKSAIKTELKHMSHWADKVVWVQKTSDIDDSAAAFVSDKDWDGNGKPDTIYIITNQISSKDDIAFVAEVADIIEHEAAHIMQGRKTDEGYQFADESVAQSAEKGFEKRVEEMMGANNNSNYSSPMSAAARLSVIDSLVKISNSLDKKGFLKEADMVDGIITKIHGKDPVESVELTDEGFPPTSSCNSCGVNGCSCKDGGGSYMAKPQLSNIEEKARSLNHMIQDGEEIHDWMESYVAQADKMLTDVEHRLSYDKN
jgi:hypothetical protein